MSLSFLFRTVQAAALVALSLGCDAHPKGATYGYVGEGDAAIVGLVRKIHMSPPEGIERQIKSELSQGNPSKDILTEDYMIRRGAKCSETSLVVCGFKGEAILFFKDQGIYSRTEFHINVFLTETPQRITVTKIAAHSKVPIQSRFRPR